MFWNKRSHELRPAHTITPKKETKKKSRSPTEALESHSSGQSGRQERSTHRDSLQGSVHHLVPIAGTATLEEIGHVISTGKWSVGDIFSQKFTQRAPAIADLVLQQALRWDQAADFVDVILVHLLALVGEVPAEEGLEKLVQHRVVHAGSPAEVRNKAVFRIAHTPKDSLHDGSVGYQLADKSPQIYSSVNLRMPRVHITSSQNNLSIRVGFNQLFSKSTGGPIADSLYTQDQSSFHCLSDW
ncbi:hypothetical protein AO1008_06348 [Aspergillus oryzae 100-8]|uniref:Uncharacterized protein n=1 Tax=Aspergillus oryzae (strain 3.042) TaxID=1160506 RepID=I8A351_ASPO3|nr:hypothetical protein Ao3042_04658 [Aspergillus oryzae 3.042]KDE80073.1 hypothetical protein AO1008_06348 [Aspergillus oryzae 100-8]|eukprot:EIT78839.1 hypothetical protein Ao3042_04658 [Aspergillus oryzae 3.042]